jgi:hypothetical protein
MPASAPTDPSPRQLLVTAQSMAAGMPESIAARLAGLHLEHVAQARQAMALDELLADCRTVEARPPAEQDETLTRLLRQSMQRALADDKIGAINAAMRLLGLGPASAPAETPAQPPKRKPASARRKEEAEPEQPAINPAEVWDRWRMRADHEGDWEGDDRRLVMPDLSLRSVVNGLEFGCGRRRLRGTRICRVPTGWAVPGGSADGEDRLGC